LQNAIVGDARRPIWLLQMAVGLVLLVACTNLANLVLARAESRRREFAVRTALGAGRGRLLWQATAEGILLSLTGGALGIALARAGVNGLVSLYPRVVPRASELAIDVRVLLFALGGSVVAGIVFGIATSSRRSAPMSVLREAGNLNAGGRQHVRRALVVAQFGLTVVLVTTAVLLIQTVHNLTQVDAGFERDRLVTFEMTLAEPYDPDTRAIAYQRLLEKLHAIPAVQSASVVSGLPLHRSPQAVATPFDGHTGADGTPIEVVDYYQLVMGDYFQTLGVPIISGRAFLPEDAVNNRRVAVINETLARRVFKDGDPIGRQLRPNLGLTLGYPGNPQPFTVIGVARDTKQQRVDAAIGSELFVPLEPLLFAAPTMNVLLRTTASPASLIGPLTNVVRELDPTVPIVRLRDMEGVLSDSISRPRLLAQLLSVFAAIALVLAAVGTYAVLSYFVTARHRELAVRMALGADRRRVMALVLSQGFALTVLGLGGGVVGALMAGRFIASLLFGVQPTDVLTFAAVVATMSGVALIACGLPAWRASRVDPIVALRIE
jgi:putative ABC transport system permease protein